MVDPLSFSAPISRHSMESLADDTISLLAAERLAEQPKTSPDPHTFWSQHHVSVGRPVQQTIPAECPAGWTPEARDQLTQLVQHISPPHSRPASTEQRALLTQVINTARTYTPLSPPSDSPEAPQRFLLSGLATPVGKLPVTRCVEWEVTYEPAEAASWMSAILEGVLLSDQAQHSLEQLLEGWCKGAPSADRPLGGQLTEKILRAGCQVSPRFAREQKLYQDEVELYPMLEDRLPGDRISARVVMLPAAEEEGEVRTGWEWTLVHLPEIGWSVESMLPLVCKEHAPEVEPMMQGGETLPLYPSDRTALLGAPELMVRSDSLLGEQGREELSLAARYTLATQMVRRLVEEDPGEGGWSRVMSVEQWYSQLVDEVSSVSGRVEVLGVDLAPMHAKGKQLLSFLSRLMQLLLQEDPTALSKERRTLWQGLLEDWCARFSDSSEPTWNVVRAHPDVASAWEGAKKVQEALSSGDKELSSVVAQQQLFCSTWDPRRAETWSFGVALLHLLAPESAQRLENELARQPHTSEEIVQRWQDLHREVEQRLEVQGASGGAEISRDQIRAQSLADVAGRCLAGPPPQRPSLGEIAEDLPASELKQLETVVRAHLHQPGRILKARVLLMALLSLTLFLALLWLLPIKTRSIQLEETVARLRMDHPDLKPAQLLQHAVEQELASMAEKLSWSLTDEEKSSLVTAMMRTLSPSQK